MTGAVFSGQVINRRHAVSRVIGAGVSRRVVRRGKTGCAHPHDQRGEFSRVNAQPTAARQRDGGGEGVFERAERAA